MKRSLCLLAVGLMSLPLLAQLTVPKIGTVRYRDGSLHSVQGLPANMIVADLPLESTDAASFSDAGGIIAQKGFIRLLSHDFQTVAEVPASDHALLAIDGDLNTALAWLPAIHTLIHWNGERFDTFNLPDSDLEGKVTDLQVSTPKQARLIVLHADNTVSGVSVSLRNGNLITSEQLSGVRGYTVGQGCYFLYASGKELVADNLRGYRRSLPLPADDLVAERMSSGWLHLYSPGRRQNWALHLTQADLELSILPGPPERIVSSTGIAPTRSTN